MKLVVVNEHTLGVLRNRNLEILHTSILKGSPWSPYSQIYIINETVRQATLLDFENFRVSSKGFEPYLN